MCSLIRFLSEQLVLIVFDWTNFVCDRTVIEHSETQSNKYTIEIIATTHQRTILITLFFLFYRIDFGWQLWIVTKPIVNSAFVLKIINWCDITVITNTLRRTAYNFWQNKIHFHYILRKFLTWLWNQNRFVRNKDRDCSTDLEHKWQRHHNIANTITFSYTVLRFEEFLTRNKKNRKLTANSAFALSLCANQVKSAKCIRVWMPIQLSSVLFFCVWIE